MAPTDETIIPEETVEAAWQTVAAMEPDEARTRMEEACEKQPALIAYVLAYLEEEREEVQELGVYLYYVVHQIFESHAGRELDEVSIERVEHHRDRVEETFARAEGSDARFLENLARKQLSSQPEVMRYVVEALVEQDEEGDDVVLEGDEQGLLFLILKTAVDALDESYRASA